MGLVYYQTVELTFDSCDRASHVKLPALLADCLMVSTKQSEQLGRGNDYLIERYGLVWVITDYEMTIHRLPVFGETIKIETEALSYNKLFCYRRFHIYDQTGALLLDILAYFALLDPKSRKAAVIPDDLVAPYRCPFVKKIQRSSKLKPLETPIQQTYPVRYFDIDMNGHVNNSKYLEWMYDALGDAFLGKYRPTQLTLTYKKEVPPGGSITSCHLLDGETSYHEIMSNGQLSAQAKIEWQPISIESEKTSDL